MYRSIQYNGEWGCMITSYFRDMYRFFDLVDYIINRDKVR